MAENQAIDAINNATTAEGTTFDGSMAVKDRADSPLSKREEFNRIQVFAHSHCNAFIMLNWI
jgi:hypothetical protein